MKQKVLRYALGGAYIGVVPKLETIWHVWRLLTRIGVVDIANG